LRSRLATARRGREQLDRKMRILVPELQRRRLQADRCRREWAAAMDQAQTWLLRAALLGGQDVVRHAVGPDLAEVELTWTTTVGLSYPVDVTVVGPDDALPLAGNAAIGPAAAAYRAALLAGVRTAAAEEAVRRVEAESAITSRRLRALEKRWLPALDDALRALELSLEQSEQEDSMRLRRTAAGQDDRRSAT
jgi:V/A-type H+-transporting ATPase subunit D